MKIFSLIFRALVISVANGFHILLFVTIFQRCIDCAQTFTEDTYEANYAKCLREAPSYCTCNTSVSGGVNSNYNTVVTVISMFFFTFFALQSLITYLYTLTFCDRSPMIAIGWDCFRTAALLTPFGLIGLACSKHLQAAVQQTSQEDTSQCNRWVKCHTIYCACMALLTFGDSIIHWADYPYVNVTCGFSILATYAYSFVICDPPI